MALRLARPLQGFRLARVLRAGGGDDAKPRWTLPAADYHKYTYQPSIPDKHFNIGHWNYAPITMWLRARRPAMEKVLGDSWSTSKTWAWSIWGPIQGVIDTNLPGFGFKVVAVVGLLIGYNISVMQITKHTEAWMFLEKLRLFAVGDDLVKKGFFQSDADDQESREHGFQHTAERLETLWTNALADATETRSFDRLCEHLQVDEAHLPHDVEDLPKPVSWRFSMMPYGASDPDTKTTGFSTADTGSQSTFIFLDVGSTGDYPDRQDNKSNPIRKGRHHYTSAYMPPTK